MNGTIIHHPGIDLFLGVIAHQTVFLWSFFQEFKGRTRYTSSRCICFERSFNARTGMITAIGDDDGMAKFTGKSIVAINDLTIRYNSTANTGSKGDHDEVFHAFGGAIHHFTYCGSIGIVGEPRRNIKFIGHQFSQRHNAFPAQVGRIFNRSVINISVGRTDADASDVLRSAGLRNGRLQRLKKFIDKLVDLLMLMRENSSMIRNIAAVIHQSKLRVGAANIDANGILL